MQTHTHTHIEARTENTENTHHDIAITVCKFSKFGKSSSLLRCHFNGLGNRGVGVIAPLQVSLPLHIYIYIFIHRYILYTSLRNRFRLQGSLATLDSFFLFLCWRANVFGWFDFVQYLVCSHAGHKVSYYSVCFFFLGAQIAVVL